MVKFYEFFEKIVEKMNNLIFTIILVGGITAILFGIWANYMNELSKIQEIDEPLNTESTINEFKDLTFEEAVILQCNKDYAKDVDVKFCINAKLNPSFSTSESEIEVRKELMPIGFSELTCKRGLLDIIDISGKFTNGFDFHESVWFTIMITDLNGNMVSTDSLEIKNIAPRITRSFSGITNWDGPFENCFIQVTYPDSLKSEMLRYGTSIPPEERVISEERYQRIMEENMKKREQECSEWREILDNSQSSTYVDEQLELRGLSKFDRSIIMRELMDIQRDWVNLCMK